MRKRVEGLLHVSKKKEKIIKYILKNKKNEAEFRYANLIA